MRKNEDKGGDKDSTDDPLHVVVEGVGLVPAVALVWVVAHPCLLTSFHLNSLAMNELLIQHQLRFLPKLNLDLLIFIKIIFLALSTLFLFNSYYLIYM